LVLSIGTGDPVFGSLPVEAQALEDVADAFDGEHSARESLLETDLGDEFSTPYALVFAKITR
jgi:hypothetical protein